MNVYDFDGTIYRGDCTLDFWFYCIRRKPMVLRTLPNALRAALLFSLHKCSREKFKETFYRFLFYLPDTKEYAADFWNSHIGKIKPWYLKQKQESDLVISASPDFLISVVCERLGIKWLASSVDANSGRLLSPNCRGEEKVRRLLQVYPRAQVERFYSDSPSDAPMAALALKAYRVEGDKLSEWRAK